MHLGSIGNALNKFGTPHLSKARNKDAYSFSFLGQFVRECHAVPSHAIDGIIPLVDTDNKL
jgi:hypothetical protein